MSRFLSRLGRQNSEANSIRSSKSVESIAASLPPKTHDILVRPAQGCTPKPRPELTAEQHDKLAQLRDHLHQYVAANPPEDDYKPWEQSWIADDDLYRRYLRAAKGDLNNAKQRIKGTLEWRRSFRPEIIPPGDVSVEGETGKHVLSGFDKEGRPVLYLRPGRENTTPSQRQIRYLVWSLERAVDMMPPGVDNIAIVIDYKGATTQSNPSLATAREVANILQNHYVERMGRAFVCNVPWILNAFFTAITPFLDPITKDKIRFNADLKEFIPVEQLDVEFSGGRYNYDFDFKTYWNTIVDFCGIAQDGTRTHPSYARSGSGAPNQEGPSSTAAKSTDASGVAPTPADMAGSQAVQDHADKLAAEQDVTHGASAVGIGAAAGAAGAIGIAGAGSAAAAAATTNGVKSQGPYTYLQSVEAYEKLMNDYDTFLFDCDGVLWSGDETIPGAVSVLEKLRKRGKQVIFVTNNASKSRETYLKKFAGMKIQADISEIFSSSYASAVYLKRVLKFPADRKVYVIGMHGIEEELDAEGILHCGGTNPQDNVFLPALDFTTLQSAEAIDPKVGAVVCGFDMHMSYIKLAKAFKHLTRPGAEGEVKEGEEGGGCHFILTNDDSTFPAKGGPWPGAGSLSVPLIFSTKRTPTIVGKPHKPMLDCIIATKQFDPKRAIMVGDRLNTDIEFAKEGKIASLMVLTGISRKAEIDAPDAKTVPDFLIDSLGDLDALP
ncbi:uncharacterized protein PFL1_01631 [Pseudozyma flocculosa PF-1]|uniref:4-nitrophenylphosphatase n=1 Tax=Pseudozyma flocculosa TaxID=84751 RepID=A0A5C3EXV2_9BASI|nr:uncharacterized protein PFL1_01631 [Pseudozyma flocculosa PF-1]EPQ30730.1 hypothetical protein PFL1_01631 [Pseudozyma flocculosa PF-1]SPO36922.1 related to PDR16 - protein involved in lipid biosynthesis and multidrug resistance / PHO13 -4-nitrophenylphosphatase [Pseudozyma flocculosa]